MSDGLQFKITGLDELQAKLEELAPRVARKIEKGALKDASQILIKEMAATVPKDTGLAAQHFGVKVSTKRLSGKGDIAARAFVGGQTGVKYEPPKAFRKKLKGTFLGWARSVNLAIHFLEFGSHKEGKRPFMSQSWEASKGSVLQQIVDDIHEGLGL